MNQIYKRKSRRLFAFITCLALLGMFVPNKSTTVATPTTADGTMTVSQIQKNMGLGFNIGNALDSCDDSHKCNAQNHELEWGNPSITQAYVDTIYAKGFRSIRLPVTWYEFISNDGNYTIDRSYLARVKEVVDYAYGKGMYVILNVHHEKWINRSDLPTAYNAMSTELKKVWTQIATYFANYDQHLIFEGMNEPRAVDNSGIDEWVGNTACYEVINKLDADFIKTIRNIESPYKNSRMLMVPCYAASVNPSVYGAMDMNLFSDPYVAASIHAYSPYNFAMGEGDHSTFSAAYKADLDGIFSGLRSQFTTNGVPVVLGEFSTSNFNNLQARKDWASYYMTWAKKLGIPCFLWDNNVIEVQSNGEAHGYLNRTNNTWFSQSEPVVDMLLSTLNSTSVSWKEEATYPIYKHNNISDATAIAVSSYATIDNFSSFLKAGNEIAFQYTDKTPMIALAYGNEWQGWTEVIPTDYDYQNKIAYFSCDKILAAWNHSNPIDHMKLIDTDYNDLILPAYVLVATHEKVPTTTEATTTTEASTSAATTTTTEASTSTSTTTTTEASTSAATTTSVDATTAEKPNDTSTTETIEETTPPAPGEVTDLIINANYTDSKNKATYKIMGISKTGIYMVRYGKPKKANAATVSVPKTVSINGITCKVTSIAPKAFYKNKKLKKITLGANIIRIGDRAFYGCNKLNKVIMKKKVKEVGKQAFGKCKKLKKFTVGKKKISYKKFLKKYK